MILYDHALANPSTELQYFPKLTVFSRGKRIPPIFQMPHVGTKWIIYPSSMALVTHADCASSFLSLLMVYVYVLSHFKFYLCSILSIFSISWKPPFSIYLERKIICFDKSRKCAADIFSVNKVFSAAEDCITSIYSLMYSFDEGFVLKIHASDTLVYRISV